MEATSWTLKLILYDNCASGTQNIHLHYVIGAGHIWPGLKIMKVNTVIPIASQRIFGIFLNSMT